MPSPGRSRLRSLASHTGIALAISALVIVLSVDEVMHFGLFQRLELASLDYRFLSRGVNPAIRDSSHVVIVEINEESHRSIAASFPWPRDYYAHLVRNLKRAGARAVGIDLIFDAPDGHGHAGDSTLRAALAETDFVILSGKREQDKEGYERLSAKRDLGNIFADTDSAIGLVNLRADADGVYRLYNPYFLMGTTSSEDIPVPTFAFAVLDRVFGFPVGSAPKNERNSFRYADRVIPKYDAASFLVNFYGPNGTFKHVQFHDVIDDETFTTADEQATGAQTNTFSDPDYGYLYDGTFRDKIVLVGVTVPEDKDLFPVSISRGRQRGDNQMYGVEIHANVIENVLRNEFLSVEPPIVEIPVAVLLVLITFLATSALRGPTHTRQVFLESACVVIVAAEIVAVLAVSVGLFTHANVVVKIVSPLFAVAAGYVGATAHNLVTERRQRVMIKTMFSTYVNPSVVDELLADPDKLALGGKRKELTVLFSDIEGFTTIAQTMDPEYLVKSLNDYLDEMSAVIFKYDGTVDKYEGDAIMAFWGAPVPQADHALRACRAAIDMRDHLEELNQAWKVQGRPQFHMRVGINTGDMIVGNMGSSGKFAYTVIGDSVNLASRLEGANKEFRSSIMASRKTYEFVRESIVGRELDIITVKGRSEPVGVFELIEERDGPTDARLLEFLTLYEEGMRLFHNRRWKEAGALFEQSLKAKPDDYPAHMHVERCLRFSTLPDEECSDIVVLREK